MAFKNIPISEATAILEGFALTRARAVAHQVVDKLSPYCSKIGFVGSVRRNKPVVKDIEICCIPNLDLISQGLFDTDSVRSGKFIKECAGLGQILKGKPADGRYVQILLPEGINLDLFIPQPEDFYRQYAIRTGSAEYSARIIATGWRKLGWVGTEHGLRREQYCQQTGKTWRWVDRKAPDQLPPAWESEREFFDWLKVPFLTPQYRNL